MLFHRILQNAVTDHFRRQRVRNLWMTPLSALQRDDGRDGGELEALEMIESQSTATDTVDLLERTQMLAILEQEISRLPRRQREAFLLRYWEDLNVAETALAMGCSEG